MTLYVPYGLNIYLLELGWELRSNLNANLEGEMGIGVEKWHVRTNHTSASWLGKRGRN